jgi:hypothetical protein
MNASGFAIMLIIGIAMFATGGGYVALALMAVGGIGMLVSSFGGGINRPR